MSALARELLRQGHCVRVFTPNPKKGAPPEHVTIDGVPVVRVRSLPVPMYAEYRWALFPFAQMRGAHIGRDVDVVHLHTPGIMGSAAFLAARRFHKPLVGTFHTNVWEMRGSFAPTLPVRAFFRAAQWYSLGVYWRCDVATAPTELAAQTLTEAVRRPFRRPVEVVPNGIEVDRFHPGIRTPDWRVRYGIPDVPLMTYLGRLTVDKGIHRFLDAVRGLGSRSDFAAIVGGSGPEESAVRERLSRETALSGRVTFVGPVAEEEKAALLSQSDLFVLPSTSDTAGVALLEAMASGAACVALGVGGPKDLISDGRTGRLVPAGDPPALVDALAQLLDRPDERAALARAGIDHVRSTASIAVTAGRFISLYEALLGQGTP